MKRLYVFFLSVLPVLASCDMLGDGKVSDEGELDVSFGDALQDDTRAPVEIPDTNDFLLYVSDSKGNAVYEGTYGDAPESRPAVIMSECCLPPFQNQGFPSLCSEMSNVCWSRKGKRLP